MVSATVSTPRVIFVYCGVVIRTKGNQLIVHFDGRQVQLGLDEALKFQDRRQPQSTTRRLPASVRPHLQAPIAPPRNWGPLFVSG
jgi:hypothetical protein